MRAAAQDFVRNRFWQACEALLMRHTNPWELDEALVAAGYGVGPCEAQDHLGLEQVLNMDRARPVPILPRMVAEGRMGKIGGVGFYRYPGGGGAVIDPLIEDLIREEAWFAKVERSEVSDDTLVAHLDQVLGACVTELANAGSSQGQDATAQRTQQAIAVARAVHAPADRLVAYIAEGRVV